MKQWGNSVARFSDWKGNKMKNRPFYSIVIPAYNCADTILATLESILAQTLGDYEVIVVNDESKDETDAVLQTFSKLHDRFSTVCIENKGPGNARNIGIDMAKGQYLFMMDADDEIEPDVLEAYRRIIVEQNPDLIVASYNMKVLGGGQVVSKKQVLAPDAVYGSNEEFLDNLYPLMNKQLMYVIWNKVYKLDIIKEHKVAFPIYSSCEDRLFNLRYYKHAQKVVTTSNLMYQYTFEGKRSLTNRYLYNKFDTFVHFYDELVDLTDKDMDGFSALFLKGVMSCIIPLHSDECDLNYSQKREYIRNILQHPQVQYAAEKSATDSMMRKVMKVLFASKSVTLNYTVSGAMHIVSNLSPKLIEKMKGNF